MTFYGHSQSIMPRLSSLWQAGTPLDGFLVSDDLQESDLMLSYWLS